MEQEAEAGVDDIVLTLRLLLTHDGLSKDDTAGFFLKRVEQVAQELAPRVPGA
jgi:hypothetical protein